MLPTAGSLQQYAARIETTFDVPALISGSDCVALEALEIEPTLDFSRSKEHVYASPDLVDEIEGRRGGKWSAKGYIRVPTAGSAPNLSAFLRASAMTETLAASTSATYALTAALPKSLQLVRHVGPSLQEVVSGAWVESIEIDLKGGEPPTIVFAGGFASYGGLRGAPIVDGATSAAATSIDVTEASAFLVRPGAIVAFGTNDQSGSGYLVTAVSSDGLTLTIAPALTGNIADGAIVSAVYPASPTITGSIVGGMACGVTLDANPIGLIGAKIKYGTGIHGLDREATTDRASRIALGMRDVSGEVELYLLNENAQINADTWNGTTRAITVRLGPDAESKRCLISMPAARMAVSKLTIPESDEVTFSAPFVCRRASAANDMLSIVFS
jgi:hypothetical protein